MNIAYQILKDIMHPQQKNITCSLLSKDGKCLTDKQEVLFRWTEYCSELYSQRLDIDPNVLKELQTMLCQMRKSSQYYGMRYYMQCEHCRLVKLLVLITSQSNSSYTMVMLPLMCLPESAITSGNQTSGLLFGHNH